MEAGFWEGGAGGSDGDEEGGEGVGESTRRGWLKENGFRTELGSDEEAKEGKEGGRYLFVRSVITGGFDRSGKARACDARR